MPPTTLTTLGTLKAEIRDWLEEGLPDERMGAAINDGIESLWMTCMRASVSMFVRGPIQLSLATGMEGAILVSIIDPTLATSVSERPADDTALASHIVDVAYTYVTESGTETLLSPVTTRTIPLGNVAVVYWPALVAGAMGWNCYARSSPVGNLVKQNDAPLAFGPVALPLPTDPGSPFFVEPETLFSNDPDLPLPPIENTTGDDISYIHHLEAQMPDLGYKSYDAAEIHSLLARRAARGVPTSSAYQNYYYDLINQRQLEFRPTLGSNWNPRYFYVRRPRRLRFDSAPIPFTAIPATGFLRPYALSRLSITIREYEAAKAWDEVAERERTRLELMIVGMNAHKNEYITRAI